MTIKAPKPEALDPVEERKAYKAPEQGFFRPGEISAPILAEIDSNTITIFVHPRGFERVAALFEEFQQALGSEYPVLWSIEEIRSYVRQRRYDANWTHFQLCDQMVDVGEKKVPCERSSGHTGNCRPHS